MSRDFYPQFVWHAKLILNLTLDFSEIEDIIFYSDFALSMTLRNQNVFFFNTFQFSYHEKTRVKNTRDTVPIRTLSHDGWIQSFSGRCERWHATWTTDRTSFPPRQMIHATHTIVPSRQQIPLYTLHTGRRFPPPPALRRYTQNHASWNWRRRSRPVHFFPSDV